MNEGDTGVLRDVAEDNRWHLEFWRVSKLGNSFWRIGRQLFRRLAVVPVVSARGTARDDDNSQQRPAKRLADDSVVLLVFVFRLGGLHHGLLRRLTRFH